MHKILIFLLLLPLFPFLPKYPLKPLFGIQLNTMWQDFSSEHHRLCANSEDNITNSCSYTFKATELEEFKVFPNPSNPSTCPHGTKSKSFKKLVFAAWHISDNNFSATNPVAFRVWVYKFASMYSVQLIEEQMCCCGSFFKAFMHRRFVF